MSKELPHLWEEWLREINFGEGWIGVLDPLILVPNGIGAILGEHRNNLFSGAVTFSLVEIPVLPERAEPLESKNGAQGWLSLDTDLLPERHLVIAHGEGFAGDTAGAFHENYSTSQTG